MLNLIIPMAGKGRRMLPHTLTIPKPLLPIAGKPIVERLVQEVKACCESPISHIGFIVKDLTPSLKEQLVSIAVRAGAEPHFYEQADTLGTAHAIACAEPLLKGPVIIAFADTLFSSGGQFDTTKENVIWVSQVKDPSAFGVVELGPDNLINNFVEKPVEFISDLAIIGIYYFRDGQALYQSIRHLIEDGICQNNEFQLTNVLERMQKKGFPFYAQPVKEWLDCGNKAATLHTNQRFLYYLQARKEALIDLTARIQNSTIIPPVYLGKAVHVHSSILGPYVSVGSYSQISGSCIKNSIIQEHTKIEDSNLQNSMVGSHAYIKGKPTEINVGDYNMILL